MHEFSSSFLFLLSLLFLFSLQDYDEKLFKKVITYKILLNLTIKNHKKLNMSMLITDIEYHEVILSKF